MIFVNDETKKLIRSLINNPQDWEQFDHWIINKMSRKVLKTSRGIFFIDFRPEIKAFNLVEKFLVHRAIKICNLKQILTRDELKRMD